MELGAIAGGTERPELTNRFAEMSSEDFIRVLFTELRNQDPLEPQDSSKLLEQLSSLRNIESQLTLQEKLESLVLGNQIASAGNLIGKLVEGLDGFNDQVQGLVTSVRVADGQVVLELDSGQALEMDRVTTITDPQPRAGFVG
ncbi:MAG: hypothetical protein OER86_11870 [Phycisphaerae bacterium]|nr:hypothetical protein [Phycisphaerae bacterium]